MKIPVRPAIAVISAAVAAEPASAHTVFGMTGFAGGLLHPLFMPAHLGALIVLALLIGQQNWGRTPVLIYSVAVIGGLGAIALAYVPGLAEEMLLAGAAVAGLLVVLAHPLPRWAGALIAGTMGLALALDSPPEAITLKEANLTLVGTAISATISLWIFSTGASLLRLNWQRVGARILGSWVAASSILVLALRMVR